MPAAGRSPAGLRQSTLRKKSRDCSSELHSRVGSLIEMGEKRRCRQMIVTIKSDGFCPWALRWSGDIAGLLSLPFTKHTRTGPDLGLLLLSCTIHKHNLTQSTSTRTIQKQRRGIHSPMPRLLLTCRGSCCSISNSSIPLKKQQPQQRNRS